MFDEVSTAADAGSQPDGGTVISPDLLCGNGLLEGGIDQFIVDNSIGKKRLENSIPGAGKAQLYRHKNNNEVDRELVRGDGLSKCGDAMDTSIDAEAGIYARVKHDPKYNTLPFSADFWFSVKSQPPDQGHGLLTKDSAQLRRWGPCIDLSRGR